MRLSPRTTILATVACVIAVACGGGPEGANPGPVTLASAATSVTGTVAASTTPSSSPESTSTAPVSVVTSVADPSTSSSAQVTSPTTTPASSATDSSAAGASSATVDAGTETTSLDGAQPIPIRLRLDRRVDDEATEGFEALVEAVLTDQRGWVRAGFVFSFDEADHDYTVVLAEGPDVDALCLPYDTFGRFSCQIGPVVALNADRWRTAVESWPASLDDYRTMLVNHEVGHLLGQHHPASRCSGEGLPAPVMAQQSSGVAPCEANPWPLDWEIVCARQGVEPLAPPYERNISLTCGPDGPIG